MTTTVRERTTAKAPTTRPQLSPFPKIADYAFVSNCHTGVLVGLDGSVGWLCVPKFDSPSVFGSLLDREAGTFRFGPYGIDHPTTRIYVPGTNVIETTWKTPTGWIVVRDALTMRPHETDDCVTPHTRPPIGWDASHALVRTATCIKGNVEVEAICEPAFDYGRTPATWKLENGRHEALASGAGVTIGLRSDMKLGIEGQRVRGRHVLNQGETVYCALSWSDKHEALAVNDFYLRGPDVDYPLGGIQMIGKSQADHYRGEKPLETKFAPTRTLSKVAEHAVDFWLSTEDLPSPDNRVMLDRDGNTNLSYRNTNPTAAKRLYNQLKSMLGIMRMHEDHLAYRWAFMESDIPAAGVAHQAGTCRFGTDPSASVLDVNCQAHEVDNLYVVDTSFFPSIGAVNPALTAMANAMRVGDHLIERMGAKSTATHVAQER